MVHNFNNNLQIYSERGAKLMFHKKSTLSTIKSNIDLSEISIDINKYCSKTEYHILCKYLLLLNKCIDLYELAVTTQDTKVFDKCMATIKTVSQYYKSNYNTILVELNKQKQRVRKAIRNRGSYLCSDFTKITANILIYECYVKNIMFDNNWCFKHTKYENCLISNIY